MRSNRHFFLTAVLAGTFATQAPAELPTTPSWIGEVNLVDLGFAYDVAAAGDVNGDGYSDALVTSLAYVNGGAAFIFHGSENGLSTSWNWLMQEGGEFEQYGISGSSAGDVNGDGYDDVIVGCWGCGDGGAAFVYHGGPSSLSPVANWTGVGNVVNADYGESVGAAGDVNGDGYDDVIVGAYSYDGGQSGEGKAFVYFGSPLGLSETPDWTFEPNEAFAHCGSSVYGAGDVNGDGFDDIVVGGSGSGPGGGAWVFHGSAAGPSMTSDWYASTAQSLANFGYSVGPAGDVNGDGYADVIVGARTYDNGQQDEGAAFVYLGSATGLEATHAWFVDGGYADALYGNSVKTAGDVNGDGYADVLVGARALPSGGASAGRAHLYYGGPEGLDTLPRWLYGGGESFAYLGTAISGVGDVNGDGLSDVIVGAPGKSNGENDEGLALAFYGRPDGPVTYPPRWTLDGGAVDAHLGQALGHAGDVNGDGLGDFLVGAPQFNGPFALSGRVQLCLGSTSGEPVIAATLDGEQSNEFFGNGIDGAGDVNGDGFEDVIIGAPLYDGALSDAGRALVYHGSPSGISAAPDWEVEGPVAGMGFGSNVAGVGDVNGDGFDDALIGAILYSNGETGEGITYLYYGSASGLATSPTWQYEPNFELAYSGHVRGVGDLNGDGFADFIIGAPRFSDSHSTEGGVFLFYGSASGPASVPDRIFTPNQTGCGMYVGALAGDVNADGYDDLLVTGPNYNTSGGALSGRIWIYHGSSFGVSDIADTMIDGQGIDEDFGHDADGAGDVNGDGYSDIIAGATSHDGTSTDAGAARIYLGSASGLSTTESWEIVVEQDDALLGEAVRGVGDMNGDGFADVLTSSAWYDAAAGADEGRVFLHLGGCYYNPTGGTSMRPRQTQHDGTPLAPRGTTIDGHRAQLHVDARSPMGRDRVSVEWQIAPDGTPIESASASTTPVVDTGTPSGDGSILPIAIDASALTPETAYTWRMRLHYHSVFVPHTRWLGAAPQVPSMVSFVTGANVVGVEDPAATVSLPRATLRPNPMRAKTTIGYVTSAPGAVRISILDVSGREVALLEETTRVAGRHALTWDGNLAGRPAPSGIYFARVESGGEVSVGKLVVAR